MKKFIVLLLLAFVVNAEDKITPILGFSSDNVVVRNAQGEFLKVLPVESLPAPNLIEALAEDDWGSLVVYIDGKELRIEISSVELDSNYNPPKLSTICDLNNAGDEASETTRGVGGC